MTVYTEDDYARRIWRQLGVPDERVRVFGREENWWGPPGPHGPCGPDSEIFYVHDDGAGSSSATTSSSSTSRASTARCGALPQHNVDVGLGLERIACVLQGVDSVYETDLFRRHAADGARAEHARPTTRAERIVSDHVRSSVLLVCDGVRPSNSAHGYVLRRLLRRAIRQGRVLGIDGPFLRAVGRTVLDDPGVLDVLEGEERRFAGTLRRGLREIERLSRRRRPRALPAVRDLRAAARADARGAGRDARLARGLRARGFRAPRALSARVAAHELLDREAVRPWIGWAVVGAPASTGGRSGARLRQPSCARSGCSTPRSSGG